MKNKFVTKRTTGVQEYNQRKKELEAIKTLLENNKKQKALSEINKFMNKYPTDNFGKYLEATIYVTLNEFDKAEEIFKEVAESTSNNRNSALVEIAKIRELREDRYAAKYYYNLAIEQSTHHEIYAIISLARLEREDENYELAEEILGKLPAEKYDRFLLEKAKIKREQGEVIDASILLSEISPSTDEKFNREVGLITARIEMDFECYDTALKYINYAKNTKKKDIIYWKAYFEEAIINFKMENYERVIDILLELIKNKITLNGMVDLLLAKTYQEQENISYAKQKYKLCLNSPIKIVRSESSYKVASIYIEEAKYDAAKKYFSIAMTEEKNCTKNVYYKFVAMALREEKYEEANFYLEKLKNLSSDISEETQYRNAKIIVEKNLFGKTSLVASNYIERQLINYDPIKALEKIKYNPSDNKSVFFSHIDKEELFLTISEQLTEENKIKSSILDIYDIDYPSIGRNKQKVLNTLRVVVVPNTKNILTMYPYEEKTINKALKKSTQQQEKQKKKTTEESQLDKFLRRYNMTNNW